MCRTCKGLLCVVPVMLVLGCAASEKGTSNGAAEVVQHMDALDTELSAHSMHIANATDMGAVGHEEGSYEQHFDGHMDAMNGTMSGMAHCMGGQMSGMQEMSDMMDQARSEEARHHKAMNAARDLSSAGAEETGYQQAMSAQLAAMRQQWTGMKSSGSSCSMM